MLNQVILVGRVVEEMNSYIDDEGMIVSQIILDIPLYKDQSLDSHRIPVLLSKEIGNTINEYLHVGMTIGVKAYIESKGDSIVVIGNKVTFINSMEDSKA